VKPATQEKTLGELAAYAGRYKAQLVPLVLLIVVALFLDGARHNSSGPVAGATAVSSAAAASPPKQQLATPASAPATDLANAADTGLAGAARLGNADLSPAGAPAVSSGADDVGVPDEAVGGDVPALPPVEAPFTCDNDASLPVPVFAPAMEQLRSTQQQVEAALGELPVDLTAYLAGAAECSPGIDPLTLVVNQLGPALGAAGPVLDVLDTINQQLPPVPVPPGVPVPEIPAQFAPVISGAAPVTSAVCGQLAIVVILPAVMASFPLPVNGQHLNPVFGTLFDACSELRG
jgi:hypothetical protein